MASVDWAAVLLGVVGLALLGLAVYPVALPRGPYLVFLLPALAFLGVAYVASAAGGVVADRRSEGLWSRVGVAAVAAVAVLLLGVGATVGATVGLPVRNILLHPVLAPFYLLPVVPFAGRALGADEVVWGIGLLAGCYLVVVSFQGILVAAIALLGFTVAATPLLGYGWTRG